MMRFRDALWRGARSILARPGRAALAAFGIGLGVAAALQLLGAAAEGSEAPRRQAPQRIPRLMVSNGEREIVAAVWTTTPEEAQRAGLRAGEGRMLGDLDLRDTRRVAVLGAGLRAELFGFRGALLETVQVGGTRFTVIGVLEPRTVDGAGDETDPDRAILVPESSAAAHLAHLIPAVDAAPPAPEPLPRAPARPPLLGALAAVSLLLGGSALASAMLATVVERAREIALRRVVGATRREVFGELLLEAMLVGTLGGVAGVGMALLVGAGSGAPTGAVAFWSAAPVLALAALVGASAGLLPALRAAGIDPVRALRMD
jgi:hypothetical protein